MLTGLLSLGPLGATVGVLLVWITLSALTATVGLIAWVLTRPRDDEDDREAPTPPAPE